MVLEKPRWMRKWYMTYTVFTLEERRAVVLVYMIKWKYTLSDCKLMRMKSPSGTLFLGG